MRPKATTTLIALSLAAAFGGFAATGAIARTATNVRHGGRSPIASFTHAVFILAAVVSLAPLLGYLPMAALAALLLIVAKNMSEIRHFVYVLRLHYLEHWSHADIAKETGESVGTIKARIHRAKGAFRKESEGDTELLLQD